MAARELAPLLSGAVGLAAGRGYGVALRGGGVVAVGGDGEVMPGGVGLGRSEEHTSELQSP